MCVNIDFSYFCYLLHGNGARILISETNVERVDGEDENI